MKPITGAPTTKPAGTAEQSQTVPNPITTATTTPAAAIDKPMYAGWANWKAPAARRAAGRQA